MKINKIINILVTTIFVLVGLSACQKIVDINLNSVSPILVVEGNVSNQSGIYTVKLSRTVNFSDPNTFPPEKGAIVSITDNSGVTQTLTEADSGKYNTSLFQAIPGKTYTLSVNAKGKAYTSVSSVPIPVPIDSLQLKSTKRVGFFGGGSNYELSIAIHFTDPVGIANYYMIRRIVNRVLIDRYSITSDKLKDGQPFEIDLRSNKDMPLVAGDTVTILLQCIDKGVFEYYRTLSQTSRGGGISSTTPANPTSNLNNGALGYFNAYSVSTKTIIIH